MSVTRSTVPIYVHVVCVMLFIASFGNASFAKDISHTDYEIIRNGSFKNSVSGWHTFASLISPFAAIDGEDDWGLRLNSIFTVGEISNHYAFQN